MKLKLLLCLPLLFSAALHGMEALNITDTNNAQLKCAINASLLAEKKNNLCIINYFKSSSARNSATEMFATTKEAAKGFRPKDKHDDSYMRLYSNRVHSTLRDGCIIDLSELFFIMQEQEWKTIDQLGNSADSFIKGGSLNCKIAIYNIPCNNADGLSFSWVNNLTMDEHIKEIQKIHNQNCHAALIVNIDSSIQDDPMKLLPHNAIRVTIGAQDKPAHFLYRHKGKILLFGGIMLTLLGYIWYARKCAYEKAIMNGYAG